MKLEPVKESVWIARDLLTREECAHLLKASEEAGIQETVAPGDRRNRDCNRVELVDVELAATVWSRLQAHVPQEVWVGPDRPIIDGVQQTDDMYGRWTPCGVNSNWRIVCYPGQGHFGPHRDADYVANEHERSLLTINGYLTDRPTGYGGATRFLIDDLPVTVDKDGKFSSPDDAVTHRVEADAAGKAVIFFHRLMHDGEALKEGSPPKWLFRTEVMYRRDPDTAPKLSEDEKEARRLVQAAEEAEDAGSIPEAIKLYRRAYKLDSSLDK